MNREGPSEIDNLEKMFREIEESRKYYNSLPFYKKLFHEQFRYNIVRKLKDIKDFPKELYYGLKNFWAYKEIIYKDRFWDYSFLVNLLVFKLKLMEKNWGVNTIYVGDGFTKKRLQVIIRRIESLEEDIQEIEERYMDYFSTHDVTDEERYKIYKSMRKEIQIVTDKAYKTFGRNLRRFWD